MKIRKGALEMLGISRKASPLNDMTAQENQDAELEKFLGGIHTIENNEYSPPEPAQSIEHDYFIKNRSTETDSVAKVMIKLDKEAKALRAARDPNAGAKQKEINDLLLWVKNQNENRIKE